MASDFYVKKMNFLIEGEKLPDYYQGKLVRVLVKSFVKAHLVVKIKSFPSISWRIGHNDNFLGAAFIILVRMGDGVGAGGKVSPERYDSLVLLWQEDAILIVLSSCYHLQHSVHVAVATGLD